MAVLAGDCHNQEGAPKSFPTSPTPTGPHLATQATTDPHTDAVKLKAQIDSESCTALATDSTLRCVYKTGVTLDSRLSRPVTALAGSLVETFCRALLQSIGRDAATIDKSLLMVQLHQRYILICFDLFLEECDAQLRQEVEQSNKRPIYAISQKANVYRVRRWKAADKHVAAEFMRIQRLDKGERPYFCDVMNPPVYENGIRLDGFQREDYEAEDSEDSKDSEAENSEKSEE